MSAKPVGTAPTVQTPTTANSATQPPAANPSLRIQTPTGQGLGTNLLQAGLNALPA